MNGERGCERRCGTLHHESFGLAFFFFSSIGPTHDNPHVHFIQGRNPGRTLLRREQKVFLLPDSLASRPFLWLPLPPFSIPPIAIVVTLRPPRELHPAYKGTIFVSLMQLYAEVRRVLILVDNLVWSSVAFDLGLELSVNSLEFAPVFA